MPKSLRGENLIETKYKTLKYTQKVTVIDSKENKEKLHDESFLRSEFRKLSYFSYQNIFWRIGKTFLLAVLSSFRN